VKTRKKKATSKEGLPPKKVAKKPKKRALKKGKVEFKSQNGTAAVKVESVEVVEPRENGKHCVLFTDSGAVFVEDSYNDVLKKLGWLK